MKWLLIFFMCLLLILSAFGYKAAKKGVESYVNKIEISTGEIGDHGPSGSE